MAEGKELRDPHMLSPETLEKAKRELNEVPEEREGAVEKLREDARRAAEAESLTLEGVDDDHFLLRFLRCKKFRQEDSLKKYLCYCRFKDTHPELFDGLCMDRVRYIFERNVFGVLEPRLKNGCKMVAIFPSRADLSTVDFNDVIGAGFLLLSRLLEDPETQVHGVLVLRCWEGVSFLDMMRMQVLFRKQANTFAALFQEAFPARFKGFWNIQEPWYIPMLFKLMQPFLSEKMLERIKFFGDDMSPIYEQIDPELLPEELGGTLPPFNCEHTIAFVEGTSNASTGSEV